jgi:hypothetical protein
MGSLNVSDTRFPLNTGAVIPALGLGEFSNDLFCMLKLTRKELGNLPPERSRKQFHMLCKTATNMSIAHIAMETKTRWERG